MNDEELKARYNVIWDMMNYSERLKASWMGIMNLQGYYGDDTIWSLLEKMETKYLNK